ncbi:MAG: DNA topoisomerase VI subunit B [Candidatus Micrarchaeia archaeon]
MDDKNDKREGAKFSADEIFKEFKEHSISEFFKKNRQMLGYSGKVRSLTTIVHEYVTNSIDACEEAGILPDLYVEIKEVGEDRYMVKVSDNGPGIPKKLIGKALASILSGTKFHRYMQQRGQQGIGASGCTLFSQITTGKPIHVESRTSKESYACDISIDIKTNKPIVSNLSEIGPSTSTGLTVSGEFGYSKFENSDHGVIEYLKRTVIANPHTSIRLKVNAEPEIIFPRSTNVVPAHNKVIKPHPLGLEINDLLDYAHASDSRKLSSFLTESFSRFSQDKVNELKQILPNIDFSKDPKTLSWGEAEQLISAFKKVKWISPELDSVSTIGAEQIKVSIKNILNPDFISVIERRPKVYRGGIPFVVEAAVAYGGGAGKAVEGGSAGNIMRFANRVPLLFDSASCAITIAVRDIQWKRYGIGDFDSEPITVMVNVSSVYVPYSGVGKEAIAEEDEIIDEIKLAVMDAARNLQRYIGGVRSKSEQETKYKAIMRYVNQLSIDLSELTGEDKESIHRKLKQIIEKRYKKLFEDASQSEIQSES